MKAEALKEIVSAVPGAEDVSVGVSAGAMQLEIDLDRPAIARYGLSVADVQEAVEMGVRGMPASQVIIGCRRYPIMVRLDAPLDMKKPEVQAKARRYGIARVPAVVVNGQLASCCSVGAVDAKALRQHGVGVRA
jgi:hypothetical protein